MTSTPEYEMSELEALAAEYVVGTLDLRQRAEAEALIKRDANFAMLVQDWQNRFSGLNEDYDPVHAPNLLPQIEARLFPQPVKKTRSWVSALFGFGLSAAAAIAVIVFLALTPGKPTLTADLKAEASPLRYSAALSGDELTLTRLDGGDPELGKDYELWLIVGENAPVSLGVIGQSVALTVSDLEPGSVLAISLESKGGSPAGTPTGPIMAAGSLKKS